MTAHKDIHLNLCEDFVFMFTTLITSSPSTASAEIPFISISRLIGDTNTDFVFPKPVIPCNATQGRILLNKIKAEPVISILPPAESLYFFIRKIFVKAPRFRAFQVYINVNNDILKGAGD